MCYDYPVFRAIGRGPSYPEVNVVLYLKGERVGHFTMPAPDPRFVKHDDMLRFAYERIKMMQSSDGLNRRSTDPKEGSWDEFEVSMISGFMRGNIHGEQIIQNPQFTMAA